MSSEKNTLIYKFKVGDIVFSDRLSLVMQVETAFFSGQTEYISTHSEGYLAEDFELYRCPNCGKTEKGIL